jgi:hypothetical protein
MEIQLVACLDKRLVELSVGALVEMSGMKKVEMMVQLQAVLKVSIVVAAKVLK